MKSIKKSILNTLLENKPMKKLKFILSLLLLLSCTITFANPISHYHGERLHSHPLPNGNVAHRHGALPVGSLSENNHKQQNVAPQQQKITPVPRKKTKPKNSALGRKLSVKEALTFYIHGKNMLCLDNNKHYIIINKYSHPKQFAYMGQYVVTGSGANMMSMANMANCYSSRI